MAGTHAQPRTVPRGTAVLARVKSLIPHLKAARSGVPITLVLVGLTLLSVGIGMIYTPAGVIAAGAGCFVFEWRIDPEDGEETG